MCYIFLHGLVLALRLETWSLAAYEGDDVGTLLRVFRRKGSFTKVFHQSTVFFFIQFVVHVSLSSLSFGSNGRGGRVRSDCIVLFQCFVVFSFQTDAAAAFVLTVGPIHQLV